MHRLLAFTIAVFVFCAAPLSGLSAQSALAPDAAARQWLSYIDGDDYAKGWARAGSPFKAKMTAQVMQSKIAPARVPLGAIMQRRLSTVTFADTAPGLPDGKYAVARFRSHFAGPVVAEETVWLVAEDGRWMVIGYFIGPAARQARAETGQSGGQAPLTIYVAPPGKTCSHDELVQARIARMNRYTGAPLCANGP